MINLLKLNEIFKHALDNVVSKNRQKEGGLTVKDVIYYKFFLNILKMISHKCFQHRKPIMIIIQKKFLCDIILQKRK